MAPATAKKPKKKNAPDKPMPEWMFPDDENNPVLNRKEKSEEQILKEKNQWDQAVNFLQHKSVSAPLKPPPPALLLTLVGAFLTSYGFDSASRIYTTQLSSRKKLDDWKFELGEKLPKGFPDLVKIFKDWHKENRESLDRDQTSSEDDDDNTTQTPKPIKKKKKKAEKRAAAVKENIGSSSGGSTSGSDESEADLSSESAPPAPKTVERVSNSASSSSSSSTSSSDSDADDEQEAVQKPQSALSSSSSEQSSSSSDSDSSPPPPRASKSDQRADKQSPKETPQSDASTGTKKTSKKTTEPVPPSKPPKTSTKSSSSSATLEILSPQKPAKASASNTSSSVSSSDTSSESSSSSSDSPAQSHNAGVPLSPSKRKRYDSSPVPQPPVKKPRTPFQRVPNDTKVDARLASNAYVSHEYGDRAHQDLSVTRGKGFTKEKNKKKRGSYRGGAIDVGGGKGIKFED